MAAKTKSELLNITATEYAKLAKLVATITPDLATEKREEDTSIKDVIAHRAHWIELFLGWYSDGLAGETVFFPAEGYKWNDLRRYNADLRTRQAHLDWPQAVALLDANYQKLTSLIQQCSEAELYGGPMKGAYNDWAPGRWAEAAGASHCRSASKYLRSTLRKIG